MGVSKRGLDSVREFGGEAAGAVCMVWDVVSVAVIEMSCVDAMVQPTARNVSAVRAATIEYTWIF